MPDQEMRNLDGVGGLRISDGTVAKVRALVDCEGDPELRIGESAYGRWLLVPFVVVGGMHEDRRASLMLTFDSRHRRFRDAVSVIVGVDLRAGLTLQLADIREALREHFFEAELGPQQRAGRETGYAVVRRLRRRL
jgi:hypothetical protein